MSVSYVQVAESNSRGLCLLNPLSHQRRPWKAMMTAVLGVPVTHMGDINRVLASYLSPDPVPAVSGIGSVNQLFLPSASPIKWFFKKKKEIQPSIWSFIHSMHSLPPICILLDLLSSCSCLSYHTQIRPGLLTPGQSFPQRWELVWGEGCLRRWPSRSRQMPLAQICSSSVCKPAG